MLIHAAWVWKTLIRFYVEHSQSIVVSLSVSAECFELRAHYHVGAWSAQRTVIIRLHVISGQKWGKLTIIKTPKQAPESGG